MPSTTLLPRQPAAHDLPATDDLRTASDLPAGNSPSATNGLSAPGVLPLGTAFAPRKISPRQATRSATGDLSATDGQPPHATPQATCPPATASAPDVISAPHTVSPGRAVSAPPMVFTPPMAPLPWVAVLARLRLACSAGG